MNPGEPLPISHLLDGRYRIHKVLGQGGMGRVYLANDTRLANRPVAVKEMVLGEGLQEQKAITDFKREASVLAGLSHRSIPQIIDFFAERGRHYLVMEFVAGGDLQQRLDGMGPNARLPENQVLRWSRQILDVLQFLHSQNPPLVYRDLKPANIMIDTHGRAMLIDFGIARFLPPGGRGTQIGSVGYAPPEQYLGKMEPRSDLYGLAATMHHLLTGRDPQLEPPFSFPPVRNLAPEVSVATASVIMRALDKDIEKRPRSAREMIGLLPASEDFEKIPSGRPLGVQPTVVLNQPAPPSRMATPPSLKLPAKVIVSGPTSKTPRRLPPPTPVPIPIASRASASAKTQDLGLKVSRTPIQTNRRPVGKAKPRQMPELPFPGTRPAVNRAPLTEPSNNGSPMTRPGRELIEAVTDAWLVARTAGIKFGITANRMIIGRVHNGSAPVDIDLSQLQQGIDRISGQHAEIIKQGSDYYVRDLGSLNGTYIGGRGRLGRDQLYKLHDRDEIVLGGAKLEFRKARV
jgi:serine/threonine protein kinase